jgi:signal transduction histidine kinase
MSGRQRAEHGLSATGRTLTIVRRVGAAFHRHPRSVDAGVAALVAAIEIPGALATGTGVLGWSCFAAVHVPLVWRRAAPVAVFWAVLGLIAVSVAAVGVHVEGIYPEAVIVVAVHAVARHRPRRHLWPLLAVIWLPTLAAFLLTGPNWTAVGFVTSVLAAAALLGVTMRTREAYLAQVEERARRLELERDQRAQLAVADERARIAREVHDIVAHNLAVMVALADGAALTAAAAPERAAGAMHQVAATGRQALSEMRRLLGLLREDADGRNPQPGLADLDALVAQVRAAGVGVEVTRQGTPVGGPGAGLAVYRIVQEALTNTLKHAGSPARAQVRLRYAGDGVELEVSDDGGGRSAPAGVTGGHGLAGMRERAAAYGGQVEAGPRAGRPGWRVLARLRLGDVEPG